MFVTVVCSLFLLKLKWPKNKNIYILLLECSGGVYLHDRKMGYGSHIFSRVTMRIFFFDISTDPTFFPDLGVTKKSKKLEASWTYITACAQSIPARVVRLCTEPEIKSGSKIGPHQFLDSYLSLCNSFATHMRSTVVSCWVAGDPKCEL